MPAHNQPGRECSGCARPLSRYNPGRYCSSCERSGTRSQDPGPLELGARLRQARQSRNLTQAELAGLAGLSLSMVSMMERADRPLSRISDVLALASALSVPPSDLIPGLDAATAELSGRQAG